MTRSKAVYELYALGVDPFVGVASGSQTSPSGCCAATTPDFRVHLQPLLARIIWMRCRAWFVQVLALCQQAGLVKLGHVALDGQIKKPGIKAVPAAGMNGEWSLICTGHNLMKLLRFGVNLHRKARVDGASPTHQELLPR